MYVVTLRTQPLMATRVMIQRIKICTGPGCRAWDAELMAKRMIGEKNTPEILTVKCMKKCGGGASVRLKDRGKIFKLREMAEVGKLIKGNVESLTEAC